MIFLYSFFLISGVLLLILFSYFTPQSMVVMLMFETFLICVILGVGKMSLWVSYFLFLMMVGGLMVLFSYMCTLSSLDIFEGKLSLGSVFMLVLFLLTNVWCFDFWYPGVEEVKLSMEYSLWAEIKYMVSYMHLWVYIFMVLYLLVAFMYMINMIKIYEGPLRVYLYNKN